MSTSSEAGTSGVRDVPEQRDAPEKRTLPWWGFGLANLVVVAILSLGAWWLLVDPAWSPLHIYPQPFTAVLFWTIMAVVWVAFNFAWIGPVRLPQPLRGLIGIGLTLVIGGGITLLLAYVWGAIDPSFTAGRAAGAGFTTGNLVVLFAFFFYVMSVLNWNQWPWSKATRQPWTGLGEVTLLATPTVAVYALLALPAMATWADPLKAPFTVPTLIGWWYSVVVVVVVTGLLIENWPWRLAGSAGRVVVVSVVGNLVLGTALYYVLLSVAKLLMGSPNAAAIGAGVTIHAAEIGVCWVFWMIAWANVFGNRPTSRGDAVNFVVRIAVTFAAAVVTYLLYYFVVAGPVLHEPVVAGAMHGDALGFMDWAMLWMLWYVLFLGSFGLPQMRTDAAAEAAVAIS